MEVGLNITDNIKINIKDSIDYLISELDEYGIAYKIPYNKVENNEGVQIILIDSFGLEIRTFNKLIYGIRCSNIKLNKFLDIDRTKNESVLVQLLNGIEDNFGVDRKDIIVTRYKATSNSAVISIPIDNEYIKISLVPSENGMSIEYIEIMNTK